MRRPLFPSRALRKPRAWSPVAIVLVAFATSARADDASQWVAHVAQAARQLNYTGTVVNQIVTPNGGAKFEMFSLVHMNENGREYEKLVSLDGPAREVVRSMGEVRLYFPDSKIVRVVPRTFRNAFPSLSPEQQKSLTQYYDFKIVSGERVNGHAAEIAVFEPKDGFRFGHRFWSDSATGLLLKARMTNERGEVIEQFAFTDITVNAKVSRAMVEPSWPAVPPDWQVMETAAGDVAPNETGWAVTRVPPGFSKVTEGFRQLRGHRDPVAHLVFSDGLVAISVFVEPFTAAPATLGSKNQGGLNAFSVKVDDQLVTVMGEAPAVTIRQIGNSVVRRQ